MEPVSQTPAIQRRLMSLLANKAEANSPMYGQGVIGGKKGKRHGARGTLRRNVKKLIKGRGGALDKDQVDAVLSSVKPVIDAAVKKINEDEAETPTIKSVKSLQSYFKRTAKKAVDEAIKVSEGEKEAARIIAIAIAKKAIKKHILENDEEYGNEKAATDAYEAAKRYVSDYMAATNVGSFKDILKEALNPTVRMPPNLPDDIADVKESGQGFAHGFANGYAGGAKRGGNRWINFWSAASKKGFTQDEARAAYYKKYPDAKKGKRMVAKGFQDSSSDEEYESDE